MRGAFPDLIFILFFVFGGHLLMSRFPGSQVKYRLRALLRRSTANPSPPHHCPISPLVMMVPVCFSGIKMYPIFLFTNRVARFTTEIPVFSPTDRFVKF
jgi:hypothetical protein